MTGAFLLLFGYGLNYFANSFGFLLFFYGIVAGTGCGLITSSSFTMVGYYFNKNRPIANALSTTGASVGQLVFPSVIRYLVDLFSIQGVFLLLGALTFNTLVTSALFRPLQFYLPQTEDKCSHELERISKLSDKNQDEQSIECKNNNSTKERHDDKEYETPISNGSSSRRIVKSMENVSFLDNVKPVTRQRVHTISFVNTHQDHSNNQSLLNTSNLFCTSEVAFMPIITPSLQNLSSSTVMTIKTDQKSPTCCFNDNCRIAHNNAMFDLTLLCDPVFIVIVVSFSFGQFALLSEAIYLPAKAEEINIERNDAAMLMSIAAIGELVGRIGLGVIANLGMIKSHHLLAICSLCNAAAAIWCPFATTYTGLVVFALCFGMFGGAFFGILAVVIVDLLGLEHLNHALGLTMLFTVIGTIAGPPFQGWLKDTTGTFSWSFYISGGLCIVTSIVLCLEPCARHCKMRNTRKS